MALHPVDEHRTAVFSAFNRWEPSKSQAIRREGPPSFTLDHAGGVGVKPNYPNFPHTRKDLFRHNRNNILPVDSGQRLWYHRSALHMRDQVEQSAADTKTKTKTQTKTK